MYTVKKAIVGASYDDSGKLEDVLAKIESQAKKEREVSGVTNHYFLRSRDSPVSLKYNYPIMGIPIVAYIMMNFYKSQIEKVAFVGNDETRQILDKFVDFFGANKEYERFVFADEGNGWSLENTIRKGKTALAARDDEKILFYSGDLVHGFNINPLICDKDAENHSIVIDLNCRENIYGESLKFNGSACPYNRRWHLPIVREGKIRWIKESNVDILSIDDALLSKINVIFSGRKTYDDNLRDGKKVSRAEVVYELLLKDWKWVSLLRKAHSAIIYLTIRRITKLNPALISLEDIENAASIALDKKIKIKAEHRDFGFLADIDSIEDLAFNEELMRSIGDKTKIYPYFDEINEFGKYLKGKGIFAVDCFPEYINSWMSNFSLLKGKQLFDRNGGYLHPKLFPDLEEKIRIVTENRIRFVKNLNS